MISTRNEPSTNNIFHIEGADLGHLEDILYTQPLHYQGILEDWVTSVSLMRCLDWYHEFKGDESKRHRNHSDFSTNELEELMTLLPNLRTIRLDLQVVQEWLSYLDLHISGKRAITTIRKYTRYFNTQVEKLCPDRVKLRIHVELVQAPLGLQEQVMRAKVREDGGMFWILHTNWAYVPDKYGPRVEKALLEESQHSA